MTGLLHQLLGVGEIAAANGKRIKVACRCGWEGPQNEVISDKVTGQKHCSVCQREFRPWPTK